MDRAHTSSSAAMCKSISAATVSQVSARPGPGGGASSLRAGPPSQACQRRTCNWLAAIKSMMSVMMTVLAAMRRHTPGGVQARGRPGCYRLAQGGINRQLAIQVQQCRQPADQPGGRDNQPQLSLAGGSPVLDRHQVAQRAAAAEIRIGEIGDDDRRAGGEGGIQPAADPVPGGDIDLGGKRHDDGRGGVGFLVEHESAAVPGRSRNRPRRSTRE